MKELTIKILANEITDKQVNKLDEYIVSEFNTKDVVITEGEYVEENKPTWLSLKEVLTVLKELNFWSIDTKYLHIYLDTRFMNGDFNCTVKDRNNNQYLTLEDLKERRRKI